MSEMMTFPDTWEEYEKLYGFNDSEEIYTNNSRLIPSFHVKQWLDHLPSGQPDKDLIHLQKEQAYMQGYEDGRKSRKGKWIATYSDCGGDVWVSWKCSNCGYVRKKGWKYTDDGKKPDALFCEMCNTDMRGE